MPSDTYHWLAVYYDLFHEWRRPFDEATAVILEPVLPGVWSMCDLCCGTGGTAIRFARAGIETYAVDLSPHMCRIARRKAKAAGVRVRVIESDMRTFCLPQPVDLVTCEFDALNHVPRKTDLIKVGRSVARALVPGGHFLFDVNNRPAFENVWPLATFIEKPGVAATMHGGHKPGSDRAWTDVEWFIQKGRLWERYREHVEEVCWSDGEIRDALARAGFGKLRKWDAAPFFNDHYTRPGYRTFWLARRT